MFMQARHLAGYEPGALFDIGFSVRSGGTLPPPLAADKTLLLLADVPIARRFDELEELRREHLAIGGRDPSRGIQHYEDDTDLVDRGQEAAREAGDLFQQRLERLADRLHDQLLEANVIENYALRMQSAALRRY
jgi:hypothetical protein